MWQSFDRRQEKTFLLPHKNNSTQERVSEKVKTKSPCWKSLFGKNQEPCKFWLFNVTLEYFGNRALSLSRSRFHLSSVGPCKKKKHCKRQEAFQGKFVVIVEGFARSFFRENLSNFCQFIFRHQALSALKCANTDHIFFHGKATVQFLHQLRSRSNKSRLKSGKAKSTSQSLGFTDKFLRIFGQN